jgi:hypothetical protein
MRGMPSGTMCQVRPFISVIETSVVASTEILGTKNIDSVIKQIVKELNTNKKLLPNSLLVNITYGSECTIEVYVSILETLMSFYDEEVMCTAFTVDKEELKKRIIITVVQNSND